MQPATLEMHQLCKTFSETCDYIGDWIRDQEDVGEESITDLLLYNISRNSDYVRYIKFTRSQESKVTGADWEWWIWFDGGAWGARVQAKRLKTPSENYKGLMYKTKRHGYQMEKLLADSYLKKLVPLYALYSPTTSPQTKCRQGRNGAGVFLSLAENIKQECSTAKRRAIDTNELLGISVPLTCFSCCPLVAQGFRNFSDSYLQSSIPNNGVRQSPPNYVRRLYEVVYSINELNEGNMNQDTPFPNNIKALLAFDLRTRNQRSE